MPASPLIRAAGVVLWRPAAEVDGTRPQLALVHRPHRQDWTLPKGKLEANEHVTAAAVREVTEETGYRVRLGRPLPTLRYEVEGVPKQVRYWAALGEDTTREAWQPGAEIDAVEWLSWDDALARLTYPHDGTVVTALTQRPVDTTPLLVVRHGKAVKRGAWDGPDAARPLEPRGLLQAQRLVPLLAAYGVAAVYSSDATRCRDTVAPFAQWLGTRLVEEPVLSEDEHRSAPHAAAARVAGLLADPRPLVVCSQPPVLPSMFGVLLADAPAAARRAAAKPLAPAEVVVLHRAVDDLDATVRVVAVERHKV